MGDITKLLREAKQGDADALAELFQALYPELRRIARLRLARDDRGTLLDTTSLVHECYLKFASAERVQASDRAHFLAYSATVMRSIIIDAARAARSERRGGDADQVTLTTDVIASLPDPADEILDVHTALEDLGRIDARLARVVEMRYFGGMEDAEIAEVMGVSARTVRRDWDKARLLLAHALRG